MRTRGKVYGSLNQYEKARNDLSAAQAIDYDFDAAKMLTFVLKALKNGGVKTDEIDNPFVTNTDSGSSIPKSMNEMMNGDGNWSQLPKEVAAILQKLAPDDQGTLIVSHPFLYGKHTMFHQDLFVFLLAPS